MHIIGALGLICVLVQGRFYIVNDDPTSVRSMSIVSRNLWILNQIILKRGFD